MLVERIDGLPASCSYRPQRRGLATIEVWPVWL
jgi:hypothetical protein